MDTEIRLTRQHRIHIFDIPPKTMKIEMKVSRDQCSDVLLEVIDLDGRAKGKPLNKYLPEIKAKKQLKALRFMMNDFSTRPITISVTTF